MSNIPPRGYKAIEGSARSLPTHVRRVGPVDPQEHVEVSVYLKAPGADDLTQIVNQGGRLSREEYLKRFGASPVDLARVRAFAQDHGLTVVQEDAAARRVVLAGTVAALSAAFQTELHRYEIPGDGRFRGRSGPLHVPDDLYPIIDGVFGLDNRPQVRPQFRIFRPGIGALATANAFAPTQLAAPYSFPTDADGTGQCIALIELGGGYVQSDLQTYFQNTLNITMPNVTSVSVDGATNSPEGTPNGADGEVDLDIEVAGALAPGATIAVYFAPNTDQGFLDAITQATHDTTNNPSVISISWGSAEANWTAQSLQAMDQAFQAAAALGITVCAAAGDSGSSDGVSDGKAHVDFPASSAYVLGCGGTSLTATGSTISSEVVWNNGNGSATGGGISDSFALPTWQSEAHIPTSVNDGHVGRGVPDVAGNADPQTGYQVYVDGQSAVFGGTSAVAPLWAGLLARLNQKLGKSVGFLNPTLYKVSALNDITSGNNGSYSAGPGWDACTGFGSPDGTKLLAALQTTA